MMLLWVANISSIKIYVVSGGTSDRYVEQAMGTSVTQIFELRGESFFRDHEVCWSTLILELLKTSLLLSLSL